MLDMADPLSYQNRVTVRTAPDVTEGLGVLLSKLQRAGLKFRGRKLGIEGLVGAVLMEFLSRSWGEQVASVEHWLPELERSLDSPPDKSRKRSG